MAIIRSHEIDKLVFEASTETGEVSLVSGKMFVGGEYVTELYVNGALDRHIEDQYTEEEADDKPAPSCLVSVYIYNDATPIRLTQCYPSADGHNTLTFNQSQLINAFRAYGISRIDSVEAEIFVSSVAQVPYEGENGEMLVKEVANIFAKGKTKIYWSPAIGFERGEPVDTRGDIGPSGVWVGSEPPPEGSEYLVWVEPTEDSDPTYTKATLHLRESVDAPWKQNIAIEGKPGATGEPGKPGATGAPGKDGVNGVNGKTFVPSIRETENGVFVDFATAEGDAIQGIVNIKGKPGKDGADGENGKSAYDIAVDNGYEGSEASYYDVLARIPSQVSEAQQASATASNSERLANQHAKDAKDWRDEAENFRHEAISARDDAKVEANKVSASVTNAQTFAKQAQSARGEAMTYASNAQKSASEASQAVTDGKRDIAIQGETIVANATEQADRAEEAKTEALKSANASANSAKQAQGYAEQAQGAVVNTLKRQEWEGGAIYSTIFTQLASVMTLDNAKIRALTDTNEVNSQTGLLAYKDRYLMITTKGWICLNGNTLNVISAGKWGETKNYFYNIITHWNVAFNGERIAVFYRLDENTTTNRHAEVFDANTGERLVDKTFTDAEMTLITSAPNKVGMSCFTKDGDIVYLGSVFDQELTHKGYVQAVDGLPKIGASPAYCCYVDNVNYDSPIMYTTQANSVWLDDRYTLDENGKPILTFRGFDPDGYGMGGDRRVQFSQFSEGWGARYNRAVSSQYGGSVAIYDVKIDPSTENKFVFTNKTALTGVKIEQVIPTNFYTTELVYAIIPFYVKKNIEIYAVNNKTLGDVPVAILEGENNTNYHGATPLCPSVSFSKQRLRQIPLRYPFYDGESLLWTRQIK